MPQNTLYSDVVAISEEYLGPAGERFIRRQINTHLNIEPEELREKDLQNLVVWTSLAFALLTNDNKQVKTFTKDLLSLRSLNT